MAEFTLKKKIEGDIVIIESDGYLNNVGGEKISETCYSEIKKGAKYFLLDLEDSKVVNSIGVSILIEIIEKLQEIDGKLGYYNLAPIVAKTFKIMGISSYSEGLASLYTYESQIPEIAETKIRGLKKHYGVTSKKGLEF